MKRKRIPTKIVYVQKTNIIFPFYLVKWYVWEFVISFNWRDEAEDY